MPFSFLEDGGWGGKSKPLVMARFSWWSAPGLKPFRGQPPVALSELKTLLSPRKFQGFRSSMPSPGAEANVYIFYYFTLYKCSWDCMIISTLLYIRLLSHHHFKNVPIYPYFFVFSIFMWVHIHFICWTFECFLVLHCSI